MKCEGNHLKDYARRFNLHLEKIFVGNKIYCKSLILNPLSHSLMPVALSWSRTGPQIDGNLSGIKGKTASG